MKPLGVSQGCFWLAVKLTPTICVSNFKGGGFWELCLTVVDSGQRGAALFWQHSSPDQQETATSFSASLESSVGRQPVFCALHSWACAWCHWGPPHPDPFLNQLFSTHIPTQSWMCKCRQQRSWPSTLWGSSDEMLTPRKLLWASQSSRSTVRMCLL